MSNIPTTSTFSSEDRTSLRAQMKQALRQEMESVVPQKKGWGFSSIQLKPLAKFDGQNPDERIYILARRHWLRNFGWIVSTIFYSLIPIIFAVVFNIFSPLLPELSLRLYIVIILAYYSFIFTNAFKNFIDWYFDTYIVTNERVLDFNLKTFASYSVDEIPLENIESVKQNSPGVLSSFFNYGNVDITTENSNGTIHFFFIANPTRVRDIISDLARIARTFRDGA
ncbi:MAG: PH domain-containing protein [Candidatus Dojkabacteria bacterium]